MWALHELAVTTERCRCIWHGPRALHCHDIKMWTVLCCGSHCHLQFRHFQWTRLEAELKKNMWIEAVNYDFIICCGHRFSLFQPKIRPKKKHAEKKLWCDNGTKHREKNKINRWLRHQTTLSLQWFTFELLSRCRWNDGATVQQFQLFDRRLTAPIPSQTIQIRSQGAFALTFMNVLCIYFFFFVAVGIERKTRVLSGRDREMHFLSL